jgi:hypothetical protein
MERIEHKGTEILYFDYRGLDDDEAVVKRIEENVQAILDHVAGGAGGLLRLTDIRGLFASDRTFQAFRGAAARLKPHFKASAIVGVSGGKKVLLELINRTTRLGAKPFDDIEKAKDWLVEQK